MTATVYDRAGDVVAIGKNSYTKSHPLQAKFAAQAGNPCAIFLHAEIAAIIKMKRLGITNQFNTMIVTRQRPNGTVGIAKPCPICALAIVDSRLFSRVIWSE